MAAFNLNGIDFEGISTDLPRLTELARWLGNIVAERPVKLTVASADASFRSYYRAHTATNSYIVMDAPPPQEDTRPFNRLALALKAHDVAVPEVHGWEPESGFMLLEDFGSTTLLSSLDSGDDQPLNAVSLSHYKRALEQLAGMQAEADGAMCPDYDGAFLRQEMELFRPWLLHRHLNLSWSLQDEKEWARLTSQLVDDALSQPRVFVHRDFHSRNLMVPESKGVSASSAPETEPLGLLDFQDAMHGPLLYDVVSLLKDCYIRLHPDDLEELFAYYLTLASESGFQLNEEDARRQFHAMGIQRHLKVGGIFARLWHRDGKDGYLNDIPRTLAYVVKATKGVERYNWLAQLLTERILPRLNAGSADL
ncbi:MAG: aminoglycoside phosphotransferase family protein [Gammaproteobacteria bacterium]